MIATAFLLLIALMLVARGTPAGRAMRWMLVERPAARLARIDRADLAASLLLLVAITLMLTTGDADPARLLMLAAPDLAIALAMVDAAPLVQALVLAAGSVPALLRRPRATSPAVPPGPGARARSLRIRAVRSANDDEDEDGAAARAA